MFERERKAIAARLFRGRVGGGKEKNENSKQLLQDSLGERGEALKEKRENLIKRVSSFVR